MSFITDQQTLDDLNMTGKYRPDSIFSLFNRVHTTGAARLLQQLFASPLADAAAINQRSAIFSYFQDHPLDFPFTEGQLEAAEQHLGHTSNFTALIKMRVLGSVVSDPAYDNLKLSLQQTLTALTTGLHFLNQLGTADHFPFLQQLQAVKTLLLDKRLKALPHAQQLMQCSLWEIARCERILQQVFQESAGIFTNTFYELDVYLAVSAVAREKGLTAAIALPAEAHLLKAASLWHPAIDKAVDNAVMLNREQNLLFLTGANMAGKSTFMKSLGVNVYLAHMGFPVAARQMEFSVLDGICTSINVADNLQKGYSHFYAEVLRVKQVAIAVSNGKKLLVIFDELFKGTNVKDAFDATLAVTAAFAGYHSCLFVISTHITEVGTALQEKQLNMICAYMPTVMNGATPTYTYRLKEGITGDRHGMTILKNEKILEILQ